MKKNLVLVLGVVVGSMMVLSANSNNESSVDNNFRRGGQGQRFDEEARDARVKEMKEYLDSAEKLTVTGELLLVNGQMPVIESEGVKYSVIAPVDQLMDLKVTNGMTITVLGVKGYYPPLQWDGKEQSIIVTAVTIDGKSIEIKHDENNMMGPRGMGRNGMMDRQDDFGRGAGAKGNFRGSERMRPNNRN